MPIVTSIKPQKRKEERLNIFLDGKFAFSLPAESASWRRRRLAVGQEITPEETKELIKESDFSLIFDRVLKFLSFRPRSKLEIDEYMLKRGVGEETRKMVRQKLEQLQLIDDEAFAKWWLDQRSVFRPKGSRLVKYELKRKGIADEIISELLSRERSETTDLILAEKLAQKKLPRLKNLSVLEVQKKIYAHLAQKGFSFAVIETAVAKILKKE